MWYKEHFKIQAKLLLAVPLFAFASLFIVVSYHPYPQGNPWGETLFERWSQFGVIATMALAALLGADSLSEEINQNTLSFLLSRSLSRNQIFNSKFGLAAVVMTGCHVAGNLTILILDQLPRTSSFYLMNEAGDGLLPYAQEVPVKTTNLANALELSLLIWLVGLAVLGVTTLLSLRTRNTLQTVIITFIVLLVSISVFNMISSSDINFRSSFDLTENSFLPIAGGLAGLALAFYLAGFRMFRRQEF